LKTYIAATLPAMNSFGMCLRFDVVTWYRVKSCILSITQVVINLANCVRI